MRDDRCKWLFAFLWSFHRVQICIHMTNIAAPSIGPIDNVSSVKKIKIC